jgi:hypothetical protein
MVYLIKKRFSADLAECFYVGEMFNRQDKWMDVLKDYCKDGRIRRIKQMEECPQEPEEG